MDETSRRHPELPKVDRVRGRVRLWECPEPTCSNLYQRPPAGACPECGQSAGSWDGVFLAPVRPDRPSSPDRRGEEDCTCIEVAGAPRAARHADCPVHGDEVEPFVDAPDPADGPPKGDSSEQEAVEALQWLESKARRTPVGGVPTPGRMVKERVEAIRRRLRQGGVIDPGDDACDVCGFRFSDHPVEREDKYGDCPGFVAIDRLRDAPSEERVPVEAYVGAIDIVLDRLSPEDAQKERDPDLRDALRGLQELRGQIQGNGGCVETAGRDSSSVDSADPEERRGGWRDCGDPECGYLMPTGGVCDKCGWADGSEERPGGSGEPVRLSDEDVEHAKRWAKHAKPWQVAVAMREKMRLERRLRRSREGSDGGRGAAEIARQLFNARLLDDPDLQLVTGPSRWVDVSDEDKERMVEAVRDALDAPEEDPTLPHHPNGCQCLPCLLFGDDAELQEILEGRISEALRSYRCEHKLYENGDGKLLLDVFDDEQGSVRTADRELEMLSEHLADELMGD